MECTQNSAQELTDLYCLGKSTSLKMVGCSLTVMTDTWQSYKVLIYVSNSFCIHFLLHNYAIPQTRTDFFTVLLGTPRHERR